MWSRSWTRYMWSNFLDDVGAEEGCTQVSLTVCKSRAAIGSDTGIEACIFGVCFGFRKGKAQACGDLPNKGSIRLDIFQWGNQNTRKSNVYWRTGVILRILIRTFRSGITFFSFGNLWIRIRQTLLLRWNLGGGCLLRIRCIPGCGT